MPTDILTTEQVVAAERRRLRPPCSPDRPLAALCLSGGGIRSAAFGLGVIQALAAARLLSQFDYLSTVSGGGFIGGWLQVLMRQKGGAAAAEETLSDPNAPEVTRLRSYTNYLTPEVGLFSADTWTAVAIYLRNLLLNWLVIVPVLVLAVLVLVFHRTAVAALGADPHGVPAWAALALATALLFTAAFQACRLLPSHRPEVPQRAYAAPARIEHGIVYPSIAWAVLAPVALNQLLAGRSWGTLAVLPGCYAAAMLAAYAAAWFTQRRNQPVSLLFRVNASAWGISTVLATAALIAAERLYLALGSGDQAQALTTFAPLALILCHMLQAVIHVGLRQERTFADLDREWIGRMNGMVILCGAGWTACSLCCLDLSGLLIPDSSPGNPFHSGPSWAVALATVLGGPVAAWLGKQVVSRVSCDLSEGGFADWPLRRLLEIGSAAFVIGLFGGLGAGLQALLGFVQRSLKVSGPLSDLVVYSELVGMQAAFALVLFLLSYAFSRVNVNRFSMHGVYRNRLSRAFLGSPLRDREADPFTGFGPLDNPRLAGFDPPAGTVTPLFPVVNIALNLTRTREAAWAERKAASFTATPLACGSAELRNPGGGKGAFVATADFAGATSRFDAEGGREGLRLGTALTISGAAVSPNWGYNSSPLAAFVMTMFNVRLGAWLPNPAQSSADDLRLASPRNSQAAIFAELMGVSTDQRQSIYLSDGGHFENLGLYEMMRRQCRQVLVIDAGQDRSAEFADLGNAIRKAAIDGLGDLKMLPMRIFSRTALESGAGVAGALGLAAGTLHYPGGATGQLIYVKPSFLPLIPAAVRAYGAAHPEFPHESTAEQWFTESQFESYRALGEWQMAGLAGAVAPNAPDRLDALFRHAWTVAASPSGAERDEHPVDPVHAT